MNSISKSNKWDKSKGKSYGCKGCVVKMMDRGLIIQDLLFNKSLMCSMNNRTDGPQVKDGSAGLLTQHIGSYFCTHIHAHSRTAGPHSRDLLPQAGL